MRNLRHNFNTDEIYSYVSEYMDLRRRGYAGSLDDLVRDRRNERVAPPIHRERGRVLRADRPQVDFFEGYERIFGEPVPVEEPVSPLAQPEPVEEEAQEEVTQRVEEQPIITATQGESITTTTGLDLSALYNRYMTADTTNIENRITFLPTDDPSGTRFGRYYTRVDIETGEIRIEEGAE